MQTQVRPARQRSSGGRTLMLLGLVLALAAAAIVFYITSSVQGTLSQTVTVVTAAMNLKSGTILTLDGTPPAVQVQAAFAVKQVDKKLAPPDAYVFTTQDALNTVLVNHVVREDFLMGDILRNNDPRLALIGTTSGTSITNINPPALPDNSVLAVLAVDNAGIGLQPGDLIDIIATQTFTTVDPKTKQAITDRISQTTLTKVPVYAVDVPAKGKIVVVLSNQDAVYLAQLENSGYILTVVIRKPGDPNDPSGANPPGGNNDPTSPIDDTNIFNHFGFPTPGFP